MYDSLGNMIRHLTDNDVVSYDPEKKKMLKVIYDTYQIILTNHVYVTSQMSATVRALQNHVIKHYGTVDLYLSANDIKVSSYFANLSSLVGYPISQENIE